MNQSSPIFSILCTSDRFAQPQPCPFWDIVFPSLLLSSSSSPTSSNRFLKHCLGKPISSSYVAEPFCLCLFTVVSRSSKESMACLILFLTSSLVIWSLYDMARSLWKHLISVAWILFFNFAVSVHVSQAYRKTEWTRECNSLIFELSLIAFIFPDGD